MADDNNDRRNDRRYYRLFDSEEDYHDIYTDEDYNDFTTEDFDQLNDDRRICLQMYGIMYGNYDYDNMINYNIDEEYEEYYYDGETDVEVNNMTAVAMAAKFGEWKQLEKYQHGFLDKIFELSSIYLTEEIYMQIIELIKSNKRIMEVKLIDNDMPKTISDAMMELFNNWIRRVTINNNILSDGRIQKLCESLGNASCVVEELDLRQCSIYNDDFKLLADILPETDITYLSIGDNKRIGQNKTTGIELIHWNKIFSSNLVELYMDLCGINCNDVKNMSGLTKNRHLKVLSLSYNYIGDEGVEFLCKYLCDNSNLEELRIDDNDITDTGAAHIADLIRHGKIKNGIERKNFSKLKTLIISDNEITDEGMGLIIKSLRKNRNITTIWLQRNWITSQSTWRFFEMMGKNLNILEIFYFEFNFNNRVHGAIRNEIDDDVLYDIYESEQYINFNFGNLWFNGNIIQFDANILIESNNVLADICQKNYDNKNSKNKSLFQRCLEIVRNLDDEELSVIPPYIIDIC